MLKKRLIASLILKDGMVIQTVRFKHTNIIHRDPSVAVEHFNKWSIDELIVLDISKSKDKRSKFINAVDRLSRFCFVPLTIGGWITSLEDIRSMQLIGADKVCINTHAFNNPDFITNAAEKFGSQCIVVAIDVRKEGDDHIVYTNRGQENTEIEVVEWAQKAVKMGAGELYITSIDHDGNRKGYDIELMRKVNVSVKVPVIAFGGVQTWQHFIDGFIQADVDAVAAANCLHYVDDSARKAKQALFESGVPVR